MGFHLGQHALHRATLVLDHSAGSITHRFATSRISQQVRDGAAQRLGILHTTQRTSPLEAFNRKCKVLGTGPYKHRQPECGGLEYVLPPQGSQATAYKSGVRRT